MTATVASVDVAQLKKPIRRTVYPTLDQWQKELSHMKEPFKTKVLEIIQKYSKRFFLSG